MMMKLQADTRKAVMTLRRSIHTKPTFKPGAGTPIKTTGVAQQRGINVTPTQATQNTVPVGMLLKDLRSDKVLTRPEHASFSIEDCAVGDDGKVLSVTFADGSTFDFHAAWLKDSSEINSSERKLSSGRKQDNVKIQTARSSISKDNIAVSYTYRGEEYTETFEAHWLHSYAPFVGKRRNATAPETSSVRGTSSLLAKLYKTRQTWKADSPLPDFDAKLLLQSIDEQVRFLENMVINGVAVIHDVGTPESTERERAGDPIEDFVFQIIGKFNQHPVRSTTYSYIHKSEEISKMGADYDHNNPLSMHTDHTVYQGTPGYLQWLHQAKGHVRSKVCDGLAIAEHVREHHPEAFKLLTSVHVTHSSRNTLYTAVGGTRSVHDNSVAPSPFELIHTHPVIELNDEGTVIQIAQSETKRGISALPYDVFHDYMEAYKLWINYCESDEFVRYFDWPEGSCVVTNNWRVMHGRAIVPSEMPRTMCTGYLNRYIVENRYRLLKQMQIERANPRLGGVWASRTSNQVLEGMVV